MISVVFRLLFVGVFALAAFLPQVPSLQVCVLTILCLLVSGTFLWFFLSSDRQKVFVLRLSVPLFTFVWAMGWGSWQLENRLAGSLEGVDVWVEGRVDGLVSRQQSAATNYSKDQTIQRFTFQVENMWEADGAPRVDLPLRLRLSQYGGPTIYGGEGWRFQVRLKRPHGFANAGGFDYERWLLSRSIGATGYVRLSDADGAVRVKSIDSSFQRWRSGLRQQLVELLGGGRSTAVLLALAMGDRSLLDSGDSLQIQQMGLSHLLAISGLHIGLAAAIGFWLGRMIGACLSWCFPLRVFGPHCAWIGAVSVALVYGLLAGFSLATQRAVVMLLVGALWYCSYRRYSIWLGWWVSMAVVLCLQPLSILEPGFWFSFVAVAVLILLLARSAEGWKQKIWLLVKAQCALFLLMGALQIFWGMGVSGVSPFMNFFAVPYVSFCVVPLTLLALFVSVFSFDAASWCWLLVKKLIEGFWWGLDLLQPTAAEFLFMPVVQVHPIIVVLGCLGLLLVILPLSVMTRLLGLLSIIGMVLPAAIDHRSATLTVLDVGQGLAVLAGSQNEWLLYDTGPAYSEFFSAGDSVILPFLFHNGVRHIDVGVISHWDSDHSGGLPAIKSGVEVSQWWSGAQLPERQLPDSQLLDRLMPLDDVQRCDRDWQLHVGRWQVFVLSTGSDRWGEGNNASCVMLLERDGFRVLLPGDLEHQRERLLLSHPLLQQPVDVLVAPHHGSNTSSTQAWIDQLSPQWVVFSVGYRNRYGHPHPKVVERYQRSGVQMLSTAEQGAIEFRLSPNASDKFKPDIEVLPYRQVEPRYWRSL